MVMLRDAVEGLIVRAPELLMLAPSDISAPVRVIAPEPELMAALVVSVPVLPAALSAEIVIAPVPFAMRAWLTASAPAPLTLMPLVLMYPMPSAPLTVMPFDPIMVKPAIAGTELSKATNEIAISRGICL